MSDQASADQGAQPLMSTGVAGLDTILGGGLPRERLYLVQGDPGTGKTTLGMQVLLDGVRRGEPSLYVTLSETRTELLAVAASHGWSLDGVNLYEVQGDEQHLKPEEEYTVFHPSEIELGATIQTLLERVERVKPKRAVIDSLSEMRLLARDPLRYRRQILALKHFFLSRGCTLLLLDEPSSKVGEHQFQTLAHGVFMLERLSPEYGRERRRLQVVKLRGVEFDGGYHDLCIRRGGLAVFPRLDMSAECESGCATAGAGTAAGGAGPEKVPSGVAELDALLGGGPERGTANLIVGAAGAGKSSLCIQYVMAAAARGERSAIFTFDERLDTLFIRSAGLGMDLRGQVAAGRVGVRQIDPASLAPGEFAQNVCDAVEREGARVVVIDSINGYLNAMPGERYLLIQMHELLTYLAQRDVLTLMVVAQHGLIGGDTEPPVELSYLADTVLLLRYFEHAGRVRKALSVLKKRTGRHEDLIREYYMSEGGIRLGRPLVEFDGVLSGVPRYTGTATPLLDNPGEPRGPKGTEAGHGG